MQIANSLQFLHSPNKDEGIIVHNDIKPHNILLDKNFNVKITDFGGASFLGKRKCVSDVQETKEYKPKVRNVEPIKDPDPSDDVFSYGVCLFIALTGFKLNDHFYVYCDEDRNHELFGEITQIDHKIRSEIFDPTSGSKEKELQILYKLFGIFQKCCLVNCKERITAQTIVENLESFIKCVIDEEKLLRMIRNVKNELNVMLPATKVFQYNEQWINIEQVMRNCNN